MVAETMRPVAGDVTEVVVDDCGHYVAEEQPARFTEILQDFLGGKPVSDRPKRT
jgi:pimeloyl-ACP methyl ester carboxylesterase